MKYILALIVVIITSCSEKRNTQNNEIVICDIDKNSYVSIFNSNVFSSITIVPIETSDEFLIGANPFVVGGESNFYIADCSASDNIYRLDSNGKLLNQIGNSGRAGNEYLNLSDFSIEEDKDKVIVYSKFDETQITYSISGEFTSKKHLNTPFLKAIPDDNNNWIYLGYSNLIKKGRIAKLNSSGEMILDYLPSEYEVLSVDEPTAVFFRNKQDIFVRETMSDIIHKINNDDVQPLYEFDFGKYQIPAEYFNQSSVMDAAELLMAKDFAMITEFMQNDDYAIADVFVQFTNSDNHIKTTGIKKLTDDGTWKWFNVKVGEASQDLMNTNVKYLTSKNEIIYLVEPSKLIAFENKGVFKNPEIISTLNENDNLVILKCKLN